MKKVALVVAMIGFMAGGFTAFGQDGATPPPPKHEKHSDLTPKEKAEKRTKMMTEELGLSADQAKKIEAINLKHAEEMETVRAKMKALKEEAKLKKDAYDKEVDAVLTDEQRKIRAQKMEERKKKHEGHRQGGDCKH